MRGGNGMVEWTVTDWVFLIKATMSLLGMFMLGYLAGKMSHKRLIEVDVNVVQRGKNDRN